MEPETGACPRPEANAGMKAARPSSLVVFVAQAGSFGMVWAMWRYGLGLRRVPDVALFAALPYGVLWIAGGVMARTAKVRWTTILFAFFLAGVYHWAMADYAMVRLTCPQALLLPFMVSHLGAGILLIVAFAGRRGPTGQTECADCAADGP